MYVDGNQLVVHSYEHIVRFGEGGQGQVVTQSAVCSPRASKEQSSQPVLDRTKGVFYLVCGDKCLCFDMRTGAQMAKLD